jgi:tetratricopeptide (TPR) repeat protein
MAEAMGSAASNALLCANASCRAKLRPPLLQCAKCKAATYCSKECQTRDWKAGHKRDCGKGEGAMAARRALQVQVQAARQAQLLDHSSAQPVRTDRQRLVCGTIGKLVQAKNWRGLAAMEPEAQAVAEELRAAQHPDAAFIYTNLGNCYDLLGQYAKAIELHQQARAIAEEQGDRAGQGSACGNLGNCYSTLRQHAKAIELHKQCRAIHQEVGNRAGQGTACGNLGICYKLLSQYAKAIELHQQARAIAEEVGDRAGQGKACGNLGSCYDSLGQYAKAIELHEQAQAIAEELGNRAGQGRACINLGNCYGSLGQFEKATTLHEQSVVICEELGDPHSLMQACRGLGESLTRLGHYAQAIKHLTKYWALSEQVGIAEHQAMAALSIGVAYTLWTQVLAEHQAMASADGGVQMQEQSAERLGEAQAWLTTALDRNTVARIIVIHLDATLHLSCVAFFTSQEAEALKHLHAHLDLCVKHARDSCAGCWQRRGEDAPMLTCSGCKVARSVLHLGISSLNYNTYLAYKCYSCKHM